jgi:hypothetical protein
MARKRESRNDRHLFFKTRVLFWLLAAIDGHAKNFSIFLEARGRFRLTLFYDVLSAYPVMGNSYGALSKEKILGRHWLDMGKSCRMEESEVRNILQSVADNAPCAMDYAAGRDFVAARHASRLASFLRGFPNRWLIPFFRVLVMGWRGFYDALW